MPATFNWLDEKRRILKISLSGTLEAGEFTALADQLKSLKADAAHLYLLVDITHFKLSRTPQTTPDYAFADLFEPAGLTLALLGAGFMMRLLAQIIEPMAAGGEHALDFKFFEHEDEAYSWLANRASLSQ